MESIKIGEFDKPQYFHYCVLQFKNMPSVVEQGQILDCYFPDKNFLLIPRNIIERRTNNDGEEIVEHTFTSLLLLWENQSMFGQVADLPIGKSLRALLEKETNIKVQGTLVCDNGMSHWADWGSLNYTDLDGRYSYLITHQFKDNKFVYRISCSESFADTFAQLEQHNIEDNTIMDLVFTGRDTNNYHNTYNFNRFKIKNYRRIGKTIFLSNVKGLLDFSVVPEMGSNYVYLMDCLLDWTYPGSIRPSYYSGMSIKHISFIPEKLLTVKSNGSVYYKGNPMKNGATIEVALPEDEEVRKTVLVEFLRKGHTAANGLWSASKVSLEDIISRFDSGRIQTQINEWTARKRDLINSIAQSKRELRRAQEEVMIIETRTKEFIPIPELILPTDKTAMGEPIYDLFTILTQKDGKYIIEQKEEDVRHE
jgi:hypothetical protein